jgi:hypothetical protein
MRDVLLAARGLGSVDSWPDKQVVAVFFRTPKALRWTTATLQALTTGG